MVAFRSETDSLGQVSVPADKLWGAQTQRSLEHRNVLLQVSCPRDHRRAIHRILQIDRRSCTAEILGCHVVGQQATDIVQIASIAPARTAASFPTHGELLIYTAVRAARKLNLATGWHAHYTASVTHSPS